VKRFYKEVTVDAGADGARLLLDGRPVKTPAKKPLLVPGGAFAEAIAEEWRAQGDEIDPASMPLTRLANSVIDGVAERADEVRRHVCAYGETDLICHWADAPRELVEQQSRHWQPVLDWFAVERGARFEPVRGVVAKPQDETALARLAEDVAVFEPFALAALSEMTSLTGSILLALATAAGALEAQAAWGAAHVDETFQTEQWGVDEEAKTRAEARRAAFMDAVRALRLLGESR